MNAVHKDKLHDIISKYLSLDEGRTNCIKEIEAFCDELTPSGTGSKVTPETEEKK